MALDAFPALEHDLLFFAYINLIFIISGMHEISILAPQALLTPPVTQTGPKSSCWESSEVFLLFLYLMF